MEPMIRSNSDVGRRRRTGAEGVVGPLELLARGVVLPLGSDALEVVGVVLEAARGQERAQSERRNHQRVATSETGSATRREQTNQCLVWFWLGKRAGGGLREILQEKELQHTVEASSLEDVFAATRSWH